MKMNAFVLCQNTGVFAASRSKYLDFLVFEGITCDNFDNAIATFDDLTIDFCLVGCDQNCQFVVFTEFSVGSTFCALFSSPVQCDFSKDTSTVHNPMLFIEYNTVTTYNYPDGWVDKYLDDCEEYEESHWCQNGNIFLSYSDFLASRDTSGYNLTAVDACTQCGGGILSYTSSINKNTINSTMSVSLISSDYDYFINSTDISNVKYFNPQNGICYQTIGDLFGIKQSNYKEYDVSAAEFNNFDVSVFVTEKRFSKAKLNFDFMDAYMMCVQYQNQSLQYYQNKNKFDLAYAVSSLNCEVFLYYLDHQSGNASKIIETVSQQHSSITLCEFYPTAKLSSLNFVMMADGNHSFYINSLYFDENSFFLFNDVEIFHVSQMPFNECELLFAHEVNDTIFQDIYDDHELLTQMGLFSCAAYLNIELVKSIYVSYDDFQGYIVATITFLSLWTVCLGNLYFWRFAAIIDKSDGCAEYCKNLICINCLLIEEKADSFGNDDVSNFRWLKSIGQWAVAACSIVSALALSDELGLDAKINGAIALMVGSISLICAVFRWGCHFAVARAEEETIISVLAFAIFSASISDSAFDIIQGIAAINEEKYSANAATVLISATALGASEEIVEAILECVDLVMDGVGDICNGSLAIAFSGIFYLVTLVEISFGIYLASTYDGYIKDVGIISECIVLCLCVIFLLTSFYF